MPEIYFSIAAGVVVAVVVPQGCCLAWQLCDRRVVLAGEHPALVWRVTRVLWDPCNGCEAMTTLELARVTSYVPRRALLSEPRGLLSPAKSLYGSSRRVRKHASTRQMLGSAPERPRVRRKEGWARAGHVAVAGVWSRVVCLGGGCRLRLAFSVSVCIVYPASRGPERDRGWNYSNRRENRTRYI